MILPPEDDEDNPLGMPEGRESPMVHPSEAVFTLLVAKDGWVNMVLDTSDLTVVQIVAAKLHQVALQLETVGATKH